MRRQIPLLRGLAILAVVCNHATGWGYTAMFWWTNRYRQVTSLPDYDQRGTLAYYTLLAIQQLSLFSVPAFLFISGFFAAYVSRGNLQARIMRTRVLQLIWPYLFWSLAAFACDALLGQQHSPIEYLERLLIGKAVPAYFFVPLLIQFYLLAPWLTRLAQTRGTTLLIGAAAINLATVSLSYASLSGIRTVDALYKTGWLCPWYAFYFPLGIVWGFRYSTLKATLERFKWSLAMLTAILGIASMIESEAIYWHTHNYGWARGGLKFSSMLYALSFIAFFMSFEWKRTPGHQLITQVGNHSYGIYLVHPKLLEVAARLVYNLLPTILGCQAVYQPLLISVGVGIPMLMMSIARPSLKRLYTYVFG